MTYFRSFGLSGKKTTLPSFVECGDGCKWFPKEGEKYGGCSQPGCFGPLIFKLKDKKNV